VTETEWLASEDPAAMLRHLNVIYEPGPVSEPGFLPERRISDRKLRLFACAVLAGDSPLSYPPQAAAEAFADGEIGVDELRIAWARPGPGLIAGGRAFAEMAADWAGSLLSHLTALHRMTLPKAAHLLRDIVGNPWRPATLPKSWEGCLSCGGRGWTVSTASSLVSSRKCSCTQGQRQTAPCSWLTPTVLSLAQAAYDHRDPATGHLDPVRLAVLADGMEEAGCMDAHCIHCVNGVWGEYEAGGVIHCNCRHHRLLAHLRSPGPHVRGCWVVDLVTGRE